MSWRRINNSWRRSCSSLRKMAPNKWHGIQWPTFPVSAITRGNTFSMPLAAFPKCFLDALCVRRDMSVDQWIDLALQFDVDGLEFYWGFTPEDDPAEWERLRARVAGQGRVIPMMCYSSDFTKPSPAERAEEVRKQKRAIRATAALGGDFCRVLSGQRRPEVNRAQGLAWVKECIMEVLPYAEEQR